MTATRLVCLIAAVLLAACGTKHSGFPTDHCVDDCLAGGEVLVVEPANTLLLVQGARQLAATVVSVDGSRRDVTQSVTWSSDDSQVATISASGEVTGIAPGQGAVTARLPTLEARARVLVSGLTVQAIHVSPAYAHVPPGLTKQFTATAVLSDGTRVDVTRGSTWSTGNGAIASIDANGLAQGLAEGTTGITARFVRGAIDVSGDATLAVRAPVVTIESYFIEPVEIVTLAGTTVAYRAVAITSENERVDVTMVSQWQSSNGAVAASESPGVFRAVAAGTADIQATLRYRAQDHVATASLRVLAPAVTALRVTPRWANLLVGQQQAYQAIAILSNFTEVDVTRRVIWQSDSPTVASITLDGVATALTTGQARISASFTLQSQTYSDSGLLRVDAPPPTLQSLSVTPVDASVLVDDLLQYRCTATFTDGSVFDVTDHCQWSVGDEAIAVIDALSGVLTGISAGTTNVNAQYAYRGIANAASVGVEVIAPIGIDGLQVTPASAVSIAGGTQQFQAHLVFSDGSKLDVTDNAAWTSDNSRVAEVQADGLALAHAPGLALINAATTYEGVEYTDRALFRVSLPDVLITDFRVIPPLQSVDSGGRVRFDAEVLLSNGEHVTVTSLVHWGAEDGGIAQSTQVPGEFIGLLPGTTTVQASLNYAGSVQVSTAQLRVVSPVVISGIEIDPQAPVLTVGGQQQMQALVLLINGDSFDITERGNWSSTDTDVAAIDFAGLLTGFSAGETLVAKNLSVGSSNFSAVVTARVLDPSTQLVALRVSPPSQRALIGSEARFSATAIYLDGSREDVSDQARWDVADPDVADVASQDGLILAKAEGTTTVTASYQVNGIERSDDAELIVLAPLIDITEIQVTPALERVASGNNARFTATAVLSDHSRIDVTERAQWKSSDASIARATGQPGEFATFQQGQVAISATLSWRDQPYIGQSALIVTAPVPTFLEVSPPRLRLTIGEQQPLEAIVHYSDGSTENVTREAAWSAEDPAIATVSSAARPGLVTGASAGDTVVTARYREAFTASADVQVVPPVLLSIELIPASAQVAAGVLQPFTAIGNYDDESSLDITNRAYWSSSDETVASIEPGDAQGLVRGVAPGSATISAALDGVTGTAALTVTSATVASIDVGPADARIRVDQEQAFIAIAHLSDGSAREVTDEVTWVSSSPIVASVSNASDTAGVALGLTPGITQIRAWYGGTLTDTAALEVTAPPVTALLVTPENVSTRTGSNVHYTATAVLADSSQLEVTQLVTWESTSPDVASISNGQDKGTATALAAGSTTIRAVLGSQTGQTSLTVTGSCSGKEDSVYIVNDVTVRVGGKAQLQVIGVFPDGCTQDLTGDSATVWKSSDDDVFKVGNKSGVVTGIGVGVATVEVKHRSNTDTATVTVIP
jgi:hypothetical protein